MPKISIYVPDAMKARMDAVEDRANWSATAQRAFSKELTYLELAKGGKTLTVIDRLRASKDFHIRELMQTGKVAGIAWLRRRAEYSEILNLISIDGSELEYTGDPEAPAPDLAGSVWRRVSGQDESSEDDNEAMAEFYGIEPQVAEDISAGYVAAFVEGACEAWEDVRDQI